MSITYQSSQTATGATDSITITKPTGTAVGDMLVAVISTQNSINSAPSGWTKLTEQNTNGSFVVNLYVYYVVATSTEVAATNFTWSNTGTAIRLSGGIARFTGDFHSTPFAVFAKDNEPTATTTPTFTNSVTPVTASSMLLFCITAGSTSNTLGTFSNQAITTSNPTWAEAFDTSYTDVGGNTCTSLAYATRSAITATGNSSVTLSGSRESASIMVVFRPKVESTTSETVSVTDTIKKGITKVISEVLSIIDTLTSNATKWHNVDKNSSSWNNLDKS